jgi:16S rRNA A1518/A1519 N6-dimethyltransferase RsmA/KsgA/DIM1 with predicted DNA glycosylase/AP lyase activity
MQGELARWLTGVVAEGRPRILLAVEPTVLAGALRELIESSDLEVVIIDLRSHHEPDHYDAAVVVSDLPHGTSADVVIRLPDAEGNSGTGLVIDLRGTETVRIQDAADVLDLLATRRPPS